MASSFGNLSRDIVGGNLYIKGKKVIDSKRNLKVENISSKNVNINGELTVSKDVHMKGNVIIDGCINSQQCHRQVMTNDGDMRISQEIDDEFVLNPINRMAEQVKYPNSLVRTVTDATYLSIVNSPDPYSRRLAEAMWKGFDNYVTIPGEQANSISGYDYPTGPIPWDIDALRIEANKKTGKYLAAYYDERDSADGRGDTYWENIKALRSYRFLPKYASSYSVSGSILPYGGFAQGLPGITSFNLTHTLTFHSTALGVTNLLSPSPIYVTPMACQTTYLADELTGIQGATDSNVVWGQSTIGSYTLEEIIATKNSNKYYFTNGPAPNPPQLPQPTIIAASNTSPIVITINGTAPPTGTQIVITGVTGNTAANGTWVITKTGLSTFSLNTSVGNAAYISGGSYSIVEFQQAPFSIYQIYLTSNIEVNKSLITRAKSAGYKVLFITMDAVPGHNSDRMQDLGVNPTITSLSAGSNLVSDPVFNYSLFVALGVVATTDANVLQYTSIKTSTPIATLQSTIDVNKAEDFGLTLLSGGLRLLNTTPGGPLFPYSIKTIANYAHSASSIMADSVVLNSLYPSMYPLVTPQLPILVKGITNTPDALLVQSLDVDGVVVSNHGGRFADLCISSLDALISIKPAVKTVNPNFAVWFDSGIRRGTDILVAYACGAEFVGIGRPCIYANILNGRAGTRQITAQLIAMARRAAQTVGLPDFESTTFANLPTPIIKPASTPNQNHNLWA